MPSVIFHGHSFFEIVGSDSRVIIDPWLTGNPLACHGAGPQSRRQLRTEIVTLGAHQVSFLEVGWAALTP